MNTFCCDCNQPTPKCVCHIFAYNDDAIREMLRVAEEQQRRQQNSYYRAYYTQMNPTTWTTTTSNATTSTTSGNIYGSWYTNR